VPVPIPSTRTLPLAVRASIPADAVRGFELDRADRAVDDVPAVGGLGGDVGAGRQLDPDRDGAVSGAEHGPQLRVPDGQPAVGELDDRLLGGLDVQRVRRVDRGHLDDGVGAL
jgi:hypothetical protein